MEIHDEEWIVETLSSDGAREYMDEARVRAIADAVERRIQTLMRLSRVHTLVASTFTEDDVDEDITADLF